MNPTLNPALLLSPVENGYVAYDPVADRLHELNPMGALIAELCDGGTRSLDEIRDLVAPLLPEDKPEVIDRWVEEATRLGLLVTAAQVAEGRREMTAKELADLAWRLWDHGKIQTAFLCQKRAAELAPDDPKKFYYLAELFLILGRREEGRAAYERYVELNPDDAEIKHLLVALRDEQPPPRMPDECIRQIYQHFSASFESVLKDLNYCGPERIQQIIESVFGDRQSLAVLDLGCGTGLAGVRLKPRAARLVGVDLSPQMIELARKREIYDLLVVAEITDWLRRCQERFDLAVACDSLIYFGDLSPVLTGVAPLLTQNGVFVFSVERGDKYPFHLADSGRYTHHPDHVREAAHKAGLSVVRMDTAFLRTEYGVEVTGLFVALQKP